MEKTIQIKPAQGMQKTIEVKPPQAMETNGVVKPPPAPETTMVVKPPPAQETTTEVKPPLGTETVEEVKPPKRSWARIFMKLFKRKKPDPAIASSLTPGEKQTPSPTNEGAVEATTSSGDSQTQEGEVQVQVKLQVTPRSGPAVPSPELDEHKINGLRSGGGKFIPCLPTILNDKSNVQNASFSNVHTILFSTDHDISVKAEVKDNARKFRKGCLPSSPRLKDGTQAAHNTSNRGKTSKLPCNRRKQAVNHAHGRKTKQGCFPQLSRRFAPLEENEASRFTFLQVGEDGNYGSLSEDGSIYSNELTYLEFKEGGRYEPKDEVLKDGEMTYLDLDKEGKYESSMQQKASDASVGPPRNRIDATGRTDVNKGNRVHPRTSVTSLESDDESSDIFQSPEQLYNDRSLPTTDPSSILLRQSISQDAFHHKMDSLLNSREALDVSNDHGEQNEASVVTKDEIKVEKNGSTTIAKKGWLPMVKQGSKSFFYPPKEGTLKTELPSIDSVEKTADISTNNEWNDPPNLLHGEIAQAQKDDDTLKTKCLRLQPLRRKVHKSSKDKVPGNALLNSPSDLLQQEVGNTPQKKKDGDFRNRCLGLQPLKYCQKKPLTATGLKDITPDDYNISDFDEPWKGEEVADFELRDFKRLKKRKSLPVSSNEKKGCQKTSMAPIGTDQNDDGDDEDDAGSDGETDLEHSKLSRGCLPFGRKSTTDYEKIILTETISPPLESYNKDDIYIALDQLQAGDYDMDCTGTVIISVDSDDETHSMEISELDNCSKSNPVSETPRDDSHEYKPPTGCLPFGRKLRNLPELRIESEDDLDFTIDLQSSDPQSFTVEATKTDWDDLNENIPQTGCFPFGRNEKKDCIEAKLMSTELDSVQSNEPQIEEEADELQSEEFSSRNPKKWCLPFGRQRTDYTELISTSIDAADTAPGTGRETIDQNVIGEGEDYTQCPLLSDWQERTSKQETGWFPSNCFSKKPAKSPFNSAENDPNQVRVDLELRNTEMHSCLPCVRKSRKEKLLYIQSGPNSGNSFEFELDINSPLMERGDETYGDEQHLHRSRDRCLPLGFKSGKEDVLENSTCMNNAEKSTTSTELQGRDSAAENKFTCTDHIFTLKKLKPTPTQNSSCLQNDAQENTPTVFTASVAEEDLHEFPKTGCARFARHRHSKKGDENLNIKHPLPASGPTPGAALESLNVPSREKVEETESAKVSCGLWKKKSKCDTGVAEVLSEMSGYNTLDMENRGIHTEDSRDDLGETSCGRFWIPKDPRRKTDESVAQSGKTSCGMLWMKQGPEKLEQSKNQSGYCDKFWMKQDPQKQIGQSVEASGMSSCSRLSVKKDATSLVQDASKTKLVEDALDESGRDGSNQEHILKELEDTLAHTKSSYCGKLPGTQDIAKQFQQAIERSRRASCDGFSIRKHPKNELEVLVDESGRAGSHQEHILKELEDTLGQTKSSNCGKLPVTQDILKQFQQAIERSRRASCDGLSIRKHPKNELEVLVDESGRAGSHQEHILKELEDTLGQTKSSNCGKLPVTQDILKQFQQAIERSRRASCNGLSMRRTSKNELGVLVDESGRAGSNQEHILKELEDTLARTKSSNCGKLPVTQDILKQFQQSIERSRRASCDGLSMRRNSKNELEVLVDESGRAGSNQEHILKELEDTLAQTKSSNCGKLPVTQDILKQFQQTIDRSRRASCDGLSMRRNSKNELEVLVDESRKAGSNQEPILNELEDTLAESKSSYCDKFPMTQDTLRQFQRAIKRSKRVSCDGLSTRKISKYGGPTCGELLMKQDSRKQSDDALDKPESTSGTSAREKAAEEKSGKANCGRFLMKHDARTKQTEEATKEPEKATCDNQSTKRGETNQFETEGNKSGHSEKFACLPLKLGERNRLGEAMDELRKITCGGVLMRPAPQKQSEVVAQETEKTSHDAVFSLKQDSQRTHSTREIGKGVGNCEHNLAECTQGKILTLLGGVWNQRGEVTHVNESEVTPLISNGGRSRKGFLERYCACMAVSDHSSSGSRCNEAPVMEESNNKYPDSSTDGFKSTVGFDCMPCFPQAKIAATTDTSRTIDCIIQSHIHTFPVSANVTTLEKDPRFEAQRELWTPESKNGCGRMRDGFQGGCGILQMNPFGKCASRTRQDNDLGLSVAAESDPLSQRHIEDDQQQPTKSPSQRSNRERWMPYLGKDSESGILKPFHSKDGPEPPVPETESRSDEQDEYQRSLEKEPQPGRLKPFNSRKGPEDPLPKTEFKTNKQAARLYPGVKVRHSCHTFCPYKGVDVSPSEVSSTARKEIEENWKECEKLDPKSVPQSGDICLGDSWSQSEWNKDESKAFTQERPENKWLRREAREPLAEQKSVSTEKRRKDWVQDDDTTSATQESTPLNKNLHDNWSRYWQKEHLEGDLEQTGKEEKKFTPQNFTDFQDSSFEDCWGRNQNTAAVSDVLKSSIPPAPLPSELESQGLMVPILDDEPAVADVYPSACGYKSMEVCPSLLPYQRNPEDDQLHVDQTSLDPNHRCLGRNWQTRQKQESVAEALEASETLLKKLTPIRLPEFESGQVESSSSGLSQNTGTCCPISLFQIKEKRKPKRIHTKDVEIQANTCCRILPNEQTNKEIANPDIDKRHMGSLSTQNSQDTFQEENQKRKKQKTTSTRRVRGSSTPVGQFEGRQIHSSRTVRDGEYGVHDESKEIDLSAPRTFQEKNEPFNEIITESEEILHFKDQSFPNSGKKLELQKSKARNNFHTVSCDKPSEPSVDRARQERVLEDLDGQNCFTAKSRNKASCSQQPKLDQSKTKKISHRPLCATNLFAFKSWTSDEDSEGKKQKGHLVSGEKKTSGRNLNTHSSRSKKHSQFALTTSTTDSSSSGDDIYDIASKSFRDNLFKNKHRDNCEVTESTASQAYLITKDAVKIYQQKTTENQPFMRCSPGGAVGPILQKFEESDEFCRSPVFKDLVAVESQMRDIAKIIKGIAGPDYLDAIKESENQVEDGNVSSEDEPRSQKGKFSGYQNPIWFAQWKEPVSVQMATRLAGDEVPVYYDEGFQIGYIPTEYRGSKGMRKTKKAEKLNEEYSKFMNQKIKAPSDENNNVYYENNKNGTHPKKRFSQKFTAKRLLHEKLHPHDHRSSAVVQVEVDPEYSSSSSNWSWKEDLIQSHRKVFCKDLQAMSIRKKAPLNDDSSDESFPSPRYEMPSVFMGQVDEELTRLKNAKRQLQEGFQEPLATTLPYKLENCNKSKTRPIRGACDEEDKDCQSDDSDFIPVRRLKGKSLKNSTEEGNSCLGWANKSVQNSSEDADDDSPRGRQHCLGSTRRSVKTSTEFAEDDCARDDGQCVGWMGGCMSPGKSREGSPSKAKKALENKEFQLLQRRVRKELGGKRPIESAKIAQHSPQEEMTEQLKEVGALRSEHATNLDEDRSQGAIHVDVKLGPSFAERNQKFPRGKSSLVEEVDVPVSSLVKLMFGTQKTTNRAERTQESASKLQAAEILIQKKVGDLEAEIANFQEGNRRLGVITKENAAHMSRLMQERSAWEAQKNADMEAFQQYKEAQMNKLQREKSKMDNKTRAQIPKKEERKEIEELRAKLAEERELHLKKELQWRQTSNRLRGVNEDLKKQIHELRKEISWHEDRLLMDAAGKGSDRDCTFNNSRQTVCGTWSANRSTSNENAVCQPREKARKEGNVNTSTNAMREAHHPAKFKVEVIKKKEQPTRIKLDVVHKNLNRAKEHLKDNSTTAVALDTLSNCEDAATALATKMKLLEKEVEQWIDAHSKR